jgi:hypothetical protein
MNIQRKRGTKRKRDVAERFWEKVNRSTSRACWEWTGSHGAGSPYGQFQWDYRMVRSHRAAYMLSIGEIPEGLHVLHRCDNPKCCNPTHLKLGTQADNMADKVRRRRASRIGKPGESNPSAKLTWAKVRAIRKRGALKIPGTVIAREFGVDQTTVSNILLGKSWRSP